MNTSCYNLRQCAFRRVASFAAASLLLAGTLSERAHAEPSANCFDKGERLFRPVKVVSTTGNVTNAQALVSGRGGYTTLTMENGGIAPMVILDYGRVVGGLPLFEVSAVSGTPKLQAIYSEAEQWLLPSDDHPVGGDGSYANGNEWSVSYMGNCGAASLSRINAYSIRSPGTIVSRLIQGGQRFQAITLTTPGTVILRGVGFRPSFFPSDNIDPGSADKFARRGTDHGRTLDNRGFFRCSDSKLNEIWDLGAYALESNQVPVGSLPTTFTSTPEGLNVKGSTFCIYEKGVTWSNYTVSFDVKVVSNETGWMVNTDSVFGYRFVLAANNSSVSTPNTLRMTIPFSSGTLAEAPLPFDLKPGTWYAVRTVTTGTKIDVFIKDQLVLSVPISGGGSFGFAGYDDTEGLFRNLLVTDPNGGTLLQSSLTDPSILDAFAAGTNSLSSIVDAPKRDRLIWSGDLAVSAPTIYYTNNAIDTVAGSLKVFGSFQRSNGRVPGNLPPQLRPGIASGDEISNAYFHSLSYSIHFVTTLYDYYLYTGDKDLVRWGWPVVQKQLAYVRNNTNPQDYPNAPHLVVTRNTPLPPDPPTSNSWHPHDRSNLSGTVTEFNALYYHALRGAARLAREIGQDGPGADYEAEAAFVKDEINATLFNTVDGIYYISNLIQGPNTVAQDANAMAVLFRVAPIKKRASILQSIAAALDTPNGPLAFSPDPAPQPLLSQLISPFISSLDVWARFQTGDADGALALIRKVWGHMRKGSAYYSGATWEALAPDGTPATRESAGGTFQSLAHGWGSGPTTALSKYVLGARPIQPGYKTWLIEPQPGDLSWAEGRIPTPYGPISVKWKNASGRFALDVVVPAGTRGTIGIPAPRGRTSVKVNGRLFTQQKNDKQGPAFTLEDVGGREGYTYVNDLAPGTYSIVASGK